MGRTSHLLGIHMNKCTRRVDCIFTASVILRVILWGDVAVGLAWLHVVQYIKPSFYVNNETNKQTMISSYGFMSKIYHRHSLIVFV